MIYSWPILAYFLLGVVSTLSLVWLALRRRIRLAEEKRKNLLLFAQKEAEYQARETRTKAELEAERLRSETEKELARRELEIARKEKDLQSALDAQRHEGSELEARARAVRGREEEQERQGDELGRLLKQYRRKMEQLADLDPQEAVEALREEVRRECEDEMRDLRRELLERGEEEVRDRAHNILITAMQRIASEPSHDATSTVVPLPNEEMKGRLIGREGRNIRAFEASTGTTLLIDETPDSVLVSCFDPVRRGMAQIALEMLIKDGRIHPASIEEAVAKADEAMKGNVSRFGEAALRQLSLGRVHPEVVNLVGKLHYRHALNQNALEHSVEVAFFCSLLASELELAPEIAKRAGLFHDMGKAIEHDYEGSHAQVAAQVLKRCGEDDRVVNAVAAHHEEVPAESPYAGLLMVADALSAMRPGARAESMDAYIQRVKKLEEIARAIDGVKEAFALQAGREVRVIVEPGAVDDEGARALARSLRVRIEDEMQYPGTIKVTVIREQRFNETAK